MMIGKIGKQIPLDKCSMRGEQQYLVFRPVFVEHWLFVEADTSIKGEITKQAKVSRFFALKIKRISSNNVAAKNTQIKRTSFV